MSADSTAPQAGDESPTTETAPATSAPTTPERVAEVMRELQTEGEALKKLATALGPFSKADSYKDLNSLAKAIDRVDARLKEGLPLSEAALGRAEEALGWVGEELEQGRRRMREKLAPELRAACEARGLGMQVLRREEPVELRIPPLGVLIDREKGHAELRFARTALVKVPADAEAIVEGHATALRELDTAGFDPDAYFEACKKAWSAARAATGGGERVEILDFLPFLALQLQPAAFRVDPTERNYTGYSRVRFAWDVLRLRRNGGFAREGWRLNLGVATGTTATQKKRVIWFEDEHGDGEFKLTVFFTRTETTS